MPSEIQLRPAVDADLEFLYEVYASTRTEELAVTGWDAVQKEQFLRMQFRAQHVYYHDQWPNAAYQVVSWEGRPVGRFYVDRRESELAVLDIALLPDFRRNGIGGHLMRSVLAEATTVGHPVRIYVEHVNPAMGLYERLGFRRIDDTGVYFQMEWNPPTAGAGELLLASETL